MFGTDLHVGYEEKVGKKSESFQEYDCWKSRSYIHEPRHEISNNVVPVCAYLIRAFASRLNIL